MGGSPCIARGILTVGLVVLQDVRWDTQLVSLFRVKVLTARALVAIKLSVWLLPHVMHL